MRCQGRNDDGLPDNPIAAVTHLDPFPYDAALVARRPLYREAVLGLWVASSADAVTAVLTSDHYRVRPPTEPVLTAPPSRSTPSQSSPERDGLPTTHTSERKGDWED